VANLDSLDKIGAAYSDFNPSTDDGIFRIVQNWGNELISNMQIRLRVNKTNASSSLSQSIQPNIKSQPNGYNLSIMMEDYWQYVENGRKPTTQGGDGQLYKNIYEWIQNKQPLQVKIAQSPDRIAATKSLAYVITRKIHREGTQAQPFVVPSLQKVTTAELGRRIGQYIADSLKSP
jgi:hypothetical protein